MTTNGEEDFISAMASDLHQLEQLETNPYIGNDLDEDIYVEIIKKNPKALSALLVEHQTMRVCLQALMLNQDCATLINNPQVMEALGIYPKDSPSGAVSMRIIIPSSSMRSLDDRDLARLKCFTVGNTGLFVFKNMFRLDQNSNLYILDTKGNASMIKKCIKRINEENNLDIMLHLDVV